MPPEEPIPQPEIAASPEILLKQVVGAEGSELEKYAEELA